jgi:S-formylglutathione hydrolase FrmB
MGGYGALSLGMEYAKVFGAIAALSPGDPNDLDSPPTLIDKFVAENPDALGVPIVISTPDDLWSVFLSRFNTNAFYSLAAAWTPNLDNPPYHVDLPIRYPEKTAVPEVWKKWKERDLVHQIARSGAGLADTAIFIDQGVGQTVLMEEVPGVKQTLAALDAQGIDYTYEQFDGDHLTHLRAQVTSALKFLSANLEGEE